MEAVVIDAGSRLLKAGTAVPEQAPPVILANASLGFGNWLASRRVMKKIRVFTGYGMRQLSMKSRIVDLIIPTRMKRMVEEEQQVDNASFEEIAVDPVVRGVIKDWDAMEDLLRYVLYTGLEWVEGNEGQILFTDPLSTPKAVREQLAQLMFETFNVSGFYASEQAVLSLYAVGRISGCTVDIGHGKIDIAPVLEGAVQHIASRRFEIGGIDLTRLLAEELGKSNPLVNISMSDVETIKERFACCTEDEDAYGKIQRLDESEEHTLPDGQVIRIGRERYTVGEALFQPSILGVEVHGIVKQLVHSISTVSSEHHKQLLENTVLCGGITKMPGFEDRFQREAILSTSSIRPSLVKPPEYMPDRSTEYSAWIGGAILAKVVFPQNQHLTKGEYDETGPSVVHRKCF